MQAKILTVVGLIAFLFGGLQGGSTPPPSGDPQYRKVGLAELRDLARGSPRINIQLKITWCGEQTKPILTRTIGTVGCRLGMKKYERLRRPRWNYGNDGLHGGRFFQITKEEWQAVIERMRGSAYASAVNPPAPPEKRGFHVILSWTSWNEKDIRWCELFLGPDNPDLRGILAGSIAKTHPAHEEFRTSILRGY